MSKTDFNLLVYFFITSGIKKNVTTNYQSLGESANASANLPNFGETSPDAISTNSEGAQENQDLVIISEMFCEEKCYHFYFIFNTCTFYDNI